jgi:hypothetical protein
MKVTIPGNDAVSSPENRLPAVRSAILPVIIFPVLSMDLSQLLDKSIYPNFFIIPTFFITD